MYMRHIASSYLSQIGLTGAAGTDSQVSLLGVTISAPLLLSAASAISEAPCHIQCNVDLESSSLEISSSSGVANTAHLRAWLAASRDMMATDAEGPRRSCIQRQGLNMLRCAVRADLDLEHGSEAASATAALASTSTNALYSRGYKVDPAALDSGLQLGAVVPSIGRQAHTVLCSPFVHM